MTLNIRCHPNRDVISVENGCTYTPQRAVRYAIFFNPYSVPKGTAQSGLFCLFYRYFVTKASYTKFVSPSYP